MISTLKIKKAIFKVIKLSFEIINRSIFFFILPNILFYYERHFLYRLRQSWGRAILLKVRNVGSNVKFHGYSTLIRPDLLKIGSNVRIGNNCYLFCIGGIDIGDNCQISRDVTIYASNHNFEGTAIPYDLSYRPNLQKVIIGKSVWIGMGASILPGVTVGDGAIIGMGAIITKDVPPGAIVVGAPQRVVKYRNMDRFKSLDINGQWFGKLYPNS